MPAKSKAQQKFMGICLSKGGRKKANKPCPPKSVAKKFARNPTGRKR